MAATRASPAAKEPVPKRAAAYPPPHSTRQSATPGQAANSAAVRRSLMAARNRSRCRSGGLGGDDEQATDLAFGVVGDAALHLAGGEGQRDVHDGVAAQRPDQRLAYPLVAAHQAQDLI